MSLNIQQQIFSGGIFIALIPIMLYLMSRAKKGKVPYVSRLPALDGIDYSIDKCAELGKPVYIQIGGTLTGEYYQMVAAALSMLPYMARRCAKLGCKVITTYHAPQVLPMIRGIYDAAAKAEGKDPSFFPSTDIIFLVGGDTIGAWSGLDLIETNDCRANITLGRVALDALSMVEANKVNGCISIQGTSFLNQIQVVGLLPDYSLIGEELYAASAAISGDPDTLSTLRIEDLFKVFCLGITAIMFIVLRMGMKL